MHRLRHAAYTGVPEERCGTPDLATKSNTTQIVTRPAAETAQVAKTTSKNQAAHVLYTMPTRDVARANNTKWQCSCAQACHLHS